MRDDLLDVYACIKWAVAQIDVLKGRLIVWDQIPPYRIVAEPDSEPGKKRLRLRDVIAPDPIINAEAGAIINSLRSSLDLLVNRSPHATVTRVKKMVSSPLADAGTPSLSASTRAARR